MEARNSLWNARVDSPDFGYYLPRDNIGHSATVNVSGRLGLDRGWQIFHL